MRLYDFYADWCRPCKPVSAKLDSLTLPASTTLIKCNIDTPEGSALSTRYNVWSIPTIIVATDSGDPLKTISSADLHNNPGWHTNLLALLEQLETTHRGK